MNENILKSFREKIIIDFIQLKKGSTEHLTHEINSRLMEYSPDNIVTRRTVQHHIKELKSRGVEVESYVPTDEEYRIYASQYPDFVPNSNSKKGIRFLRFSEGFNYTPSFTEDEKLKVNDAFILLSRFIGQPGWEWLEEFIEVGQEQLPYVNDFSKQFYNPIEKNKFPKRYRDLKFFLTNKEVVLVTQNLSSEKVKIQFHPHYIKYWKDKWYCFGYAYLEANNQIIKTYNLPIDGRISDLQPLPKVAFISSEIDYSEDSFENYFKDIIGVTNYAENKVEEIVFRIRDEKIFAILNSKKIHETFKIISRDTEGALCSIKVKRNPELKRFFLEFSDSIELIKPNDFRLDLIQTLKNTLSFYTQ